MPDKDVATLFDLINYQYAKVVACSAFGARDGREAKKKHYGFIKNTFRDLKSGKKSWSDILTSPSTSHSRSIIWRCPRIRQERFSWS